MPKADERLLRAGASFHGWRSQRDDIGVGHSGWSIQWLSLVNTINTIIHKTYHWHHYSWSISLVKKTLWMSLITLIGSVYGRMVNQTPPWIEWEKQWFPVSIFPTKPIQWLSGWITMNNMARTGVAPVLTIIPVIQQWGGDQSYPDSIPHWIP